jgi:hypothetical protein
MALLIKSCCSCFFSAQAVDESRPPLPAPLRRTDREMFPLTPASPHPTAADDSPSAEWQSISHVPSGILHPDDDEQEVRSAPFLGTAARVQKAQRAMTPPPRL